MPPRLIAIGDIHGCSRALAAILDQINPQPDDTIITLGDYVDYGPDSNRVLEQLIELRERCTLVPLRGNHEEMLLGARRCGQSEFVSWLKCGGDTTLASYGDPHDVTLIPANHIHFIEQCENYWETKTHIFVHANYWPNRAMEDQSNNTLLWEPLDLNWVAPHYSQKTVIVGHTPQPSGIMLDLGYLKCLDTACGYGGLLTALDVRSNQCWQVSEAGEVIVNRPT